MSNSILTIDMITRKALEILENNLVLTRNVNRQYDDSFAVSGAKIGSTLRIRLPDRALVTDGAALQVQDTAAGRPSATPHACRSSVVDCSRWRPPPAPQTPGMGAAVNNPSTTTGVTERPLDRLRCRAK